MDWNLVSKTEFASASWDGAVKIWSPHAAGSLRTFLDHGHHPVYGPCPVICVTFKRLAGSVPPRLRSEGCRVARDSRRMAQPDC